MDSLSYRIKDARNAIVTHLSYEIASFDDLANLTGLADDQLGFVLKDLQDAKEIRTVKGRSKIYEMAEIDNRVYSWDMTEYDPNRIVAVDVETTGLNVLVDDVLQAAVIEYDSDGRLNQFFGSSKPEWRQAEQVHGITPEMVNGLPRLCECPDVVSDALVGVDVIMGYNLAFD